MTPSGPLFGKNIALVGAGIIGLCAASHLVRAGASVRLFDPLGPGGGASFGNGGLINVDDVAPIAMPGMLRNVPHWLMDPLGPLHLPPRYILTILPWLLRWLHAGRWQRVLKTSDALRALHKDAFDEYRGLLDRASFDALFRKTGTVLVWETATAPAAERYHAELRERHGIAYRELSLNELRDLAPGITESIRRAAIVPRNGFITSPARLTASLADELLARGATLCREKIYGILPSEGDGFTLVSNVDNYRADMVVLATGSRANELLRPLNARFPLETERGYHLVLLNPSRRIDLPIVHKQKGFGLKTMEDGIRITGTVEFGGHNMPMMEHRARILGSHAKRLFPDLRHEGERMWMGFRPSMPDSLPVIGEIAARPGLFVAFGHGHYGMIGAPATGRLLADIITGEKPAIDPSPFSPGRFGRAMTS